MKRNAFMGMLLMSLTAMLSAQSTVHVSEIEERNVDGQRVIYSKGQKMNGKHQG